MHGKRSERVQVKGTSESAKGTDGLLGEEQFQVRIRLREPDVVFVKSIIEASEGLGAVFAEPREPNSSYDGGAVVIAGPRSRAAELAELIADMKEELGGAMWVEDPGAAT